MSSRDTTGIGSIQALIVQLAQLGPFFGPPAIAAMLSVADTWHAATGRHSASR